MSHGALRVLSCDGAECHFSGGVGKGMEQRDGAVELLLNFGAARSGKRYGAQFFGGGVVVGFLRDGREWEKEEQGGEERLR